MAAPTATMSKRSEPFIILQYFEDAFNECMFIIASRSLLSSGMFIESINDYLTRFPRLITEPKYRDQTRELMVAAQNYIKDVEGALK